MHIALNDELVAEVDRRAGPRRRSLFIAQAVRQALDAERRWEMIASAVGTIPDTGHEWDADPSAWVRAQRRADAARVG